MKRLKYKLTGMSKTKSPPSANLLEQFSSIYSVEQNSSAFGNNSSASCGTITLQTAWNYLVPARLELLLRECSL